VLALAVLIFLPGVRCGLLLFAFLLCLPLARLPLRRAIVHPAGPKH
jgi:hypothetical protein